MKYKKVQLLKEAVKELGINQTEAAYKMGVRYETLHQMFRRENIIIDGAVYSPMRHYVLSSSIGVKTLLEFMKLMSWKTGDLAREIGVKRQSVEQMAGRGCIIYNHRIYSPKKYRLN